VDKLVTELINPFASRLMATVSLASVVFWTVGVTLFYRLHPGPISLCEEGGQQLCGVLSGKWASAVVPLLAFAVAALVVSAMVMAGSYLTLDLLHGRSFWWHGIGTWRQERARYAHGERDRAGRDNRTKWYPYGPLTDDDVDLIQPTRLGNIFAAAHQRIVERNGLHLGSCLRLLRHVMVDDKRADLDRTLAELARRVQLLEWLVLGAVWFLLLPATTAKVIWVLGCLLAVAWMYREVCTKAMEYCDELETVVLLNRYKLYRAVGLAPPASTADEPKMGRDLCAYLDRRESAVPLALRWDDDAKTTDGK
jgi:hypothetical protein